MKNTCTAILTILLLSSAFVLTGCESDSIQNGNNMLQGEISSEKTPETYTNGTISITLEPDKYTVEVDSSQKMRGGVKVFILQELLLTVTAGVIVHLISKWLDSKDK